MNLPHKLLSSYVTSGQYAFNDGKVRALLQNIKPCLSLQKASQFVRSCEGSMRYMLDHAGTWE